MNEDLKYHYYIKCGNNKDNNILSRKRFIYFNCNANKDTLLWAYSDSAKKLHIQFNDLTNNYSEDFQNPPTTYFTNYLDNKINPVVLNIIGYEKINSNNKYSFNEGALIIFKFMKYSNSDLKFEIIEKSTLNKDLLSNYNIFNNIELFNNVLTGMYETRTIRKSGDVII